MRIFLVWLALNLIRTKSKPVKANIHKFSSIGAGGVSAFSNVPAVSVVPGCAKRIKVEHK